MTPNEIDAVYELALLGGLLGSVCGTLIAVVIFELFRGAR